MFLKDFYCHIYENATFDRKLLLGMDLPNSSLRIQANVSLVKSL